MLTRELHPLSTKYILLVARENRSHELEYEADNLEEVTSLLKQLKSNPHTDRVRVVRQQHNAHAKHYEFPTQKVVQLHKRTGLNSFDVFKYEWKG